VYHFDDQNKVPVCFETTNSAGVLRVNGGENDAMAGKCLGELQIMTTHKA